jgi:hypothetical protein
MEIVSAAIDEAPELDVEIPLEHHIDTMGI